MQVPGLWLVAAEHPKGQRTDKDAPGAIRCEVVEAGGAGNRAECKQRTRRSVGKRDPRNIASANDQTAPCMQRHAANATPLRQHQRHIPDAIQQMDATVDHVAEI